MSNALESAENIHALAVLIREVLPSLGYEEVAGMIPTRFCNTLTMPDDVEGLIAWDAASAVYIGFAASDGICEVQARGAARAANG